MQVDERLVNGKKFSKKENSTENRNSYREEKCLWRQNYNFDICSRGFPLMTCLRAVQELLIITYLKIRYFQRSRKKGKHNTVSFMNPTMFIAYFIHACIRLVCQCQEKRNTICLVALHSPIPTTAADPQK